jgi:hypothetical protein
MQPSTCEIQNSTLKIQHLFDITRVHPGARGFSGAVFDGRYIYLAPLNNGHFQGQVVRFDPELDFDDLSASGLLFPFAILADDRQETGLIRTLLGIDESKGSLTLAGDIPAEGYLKLMHASTEALIDGAEAAAEAAQHMLSNTDRPALALLVSCIGRKLVMGDRVDEEVEAVGAVFGPNCVLAGFYSNGEISPFIESTECKLHNQTMTITYLTEKD